MPPATTAATASAFKEHQMPVLRDMLVQAVVDAMESKPVDILTFLAEWAQRQQKLPATADDSEGGAPQPANPERNVASPRSLCSPHAPPPNSCSCREATEEGSSTDKVASPTASQQFSPLHAGKDLVGDDSSEVRTRAVVGDAAEDEDNAERVAELREAARRRLRRYSALASGRKDHYMMTLEDSDTDLAYLRKLEADLMTAKQRFLQVRTETRDVVAEAEANPQRARSLCERYVPQWSAEISHQHVA